MSEGLLYVTVVALPSGLYWAMMVTVWPAFFNAAAACSCVAIRRSTPFTWHTHTAWPLTTTTVVPLQNAIMCVWELYKDKSVFTLRIWSPLCSSPLRSAGPPARMKEIKIPSPSSPPTMLNPRPVEPLWIKTLRGSLEKRWRRVDSHINQVISNTIHNIQRYED